MPISLMAADREEALRSCRATLRRVANYTLGPELDRRMLELGERKEYLDPAEHAELMAFVAFSQQRMIEKCEAQLALKRLESAYPDLAE